MRAYSSIVSKKGLGLPRYGYIHYHLLQVIDQVSDTVLNAQGFDEFLSSLTSKDLGAIRQGVEIHKISWRRRGDNWRPSHRSFQIWWDGSGSEPLAERGLRNALTQSKGRSRELDKLGLFWLINVARSKQKSIKVARTKEGTPLVQIDYNHSPWEYLYSTSVAGEKWLVHLVGKMPDPRRRRRVGVRPSKSRSIKEVQQDLNDIRSRITAPTRQGKIANADADLNALRVVKEDTLNASL